MTDPTPQEVLAASLPPHALAGQLPTMTNPCNGVGCGCHPSTQPETDGNQR